MAVDLSVVVSYGDVTVRVVCCSVVCSGVDNDTVVSVVTMVSDVVSRFPNVDNDNVVSVVTMASDVVSRFPNVTGIVSPAEALKGMYIHY